MKEKASHHNRVYLSVRVKLKWRQTLTRSHWSLYQKKERIPMVVQNPNTSYEGGNDDEEEDGEEITRM